MLTALNLNGKIKLNSSQNISPSPVRPPCSIKIRPIYCLLLWCFVDPRGSETGENNLIEQKTTHGIYSKGVV